MGKPSEEIILKREPKELPPELKKVVARDIVLAKELALTAQQQVEINNVSKGCTPILLEYCFGIKIGSKQGVLREHIKAIKNLYRRFVAEVELISFRYDEHADVPGGEDKRAFCISTTPKTVFLRPAYFGLEDIQLTPEDSSVKTDNTSVRGRALTLIHEFVHSIGVDKTDHEEDRSLEAPQQFMFHDNPITPQQALHDATSYEHFAKWTGAGLTCRNHTIESSSHTGSEKHSVRH